MMRLGRFADHRFRVRWAFTRIQTLSKPQPDMHFGKRDERRGEVLYRNITRAIQEECLAPQPATPAWPSEERQLRIKRLEDMKEFLHGKLGLGIAAPGRTRSLSVLKTIDYFLRRYRERVIRKRKAAEDIEVQLAALERNLRREWKPACPNRSRWCRKWRRIRSSRNGADVA
jgi:hypothetical protein